MQQQPDGHDLRPGRPCGRRGMGRRAQVRPSLNSENEGLGFIDDVADEYRTVLYQVLFVHWNQDILFYC